MPATPEPLCVVIRNPDSTWESAVEEIARKLGPIYAVIGPTHLEVYAKDPGRDHRPYAPVVFHDGQDGRLVRSPWEGRPWSS